MSLVILYYCLSNCKSTCGKYFNQIGIIHNYGQAFKTNQTLPVKVHLHGPILCLRKETICLREDLIQEVDSNSEIVDNRYA